MQDLTGKLLVAMPAIGDPRFSKSVILICAHSDDYTMGLVLNKPIDDLTLPELLTQLGIDQDIQVPDSYVLNGGPVGTDRGFVVHSNDYFSEGATVEVATAYSMTATRDVLRALATDGAPAQATMTLGYSGWGPGQLEHELSEHAWLVSDPHEEIVFGRAHSTKWELTLGLLGVDPAHLHITGGNA
ncbi:MAG: YqgE/AlgH family protein [Pseudomonadota bacterium]